MYSKAAENPRTDKRILKTKNCIHSAFLSIAGERTYDRISVSAVCERANINRNTFYYHYSDINDLFEELSSDFIESMECIYKARMRPEQRIAEICRIFARKPEMVRLLYGQTAIGGLVDRIEKSAAPYVARDLKAARISIGEEKAALLAAYIFRGTTSAIVQWFENGQAESPEEVGRLLSRLMEHGIESLK